MFFSGKKIHRTLPFEGHRTSAIFFESKHMTAGGVLNTHESTDNELRTAGILLFTKGVYGGTPMSSDGIPADCYNWREPRTVQLKALSVKAMEVKNSTHCDLGRDGELGASSPQVENQEPKVGPECAMDVRPFETMSCADCQTTG